MNLKDLPHILQKDFINRKEAAVEAVHSMNYDLPEKKEFLSDFKNALTFSEFIALGIAKSPEIFIDLILSGDLEKEYVENEYIKKIEDKMSNKSGTIKLKSILSAVRLREMIRIAWRDLTAKASLKETLKDLSFLADACIDKAFSFLYDELCFIYGTPLNKDGVKQGIIVLGMGKLGAGELNFSSDIDLVFAFPEDGKTENKADGITNKVFFTKLCKNFLKVFDSSMNGSILFRVDTRLRPFGAAGPLVMNCNSLEDYYQTQGREWERYALIKARPVAGDLDAGYALLNRLNPFIYRRYFDYGIFDSFRNMKKKISLQVRDKKLKNNIKLGAGGIREIEFFGQIFQMIRGGVAPEFQELKILKVLDILKKHSCIDDKTNKDLKEAYVFLRKTENRLQEYADLQTHDLPEKKKDRLRLALSMGFKTWDDFFSEITCHMKSVHGYFNQLLVSGEDTRDEKIDTLKYLWENINDPQAHDNIQKIPWVNNSDKIINLLRVLEAHPHTKKLSPDGRKRLDRLVPVFVQKICHQSEPEIVLNRIIDLLITIERRTCYLALLVENPDAINVLTMLAEKSPWIISFLSMHPALLDELLDPRTLYVPPSEHDLKNDIKRHMDKLHNADIEFKIEELCIFRQINTLRVAAADISGDYPLMKVSDHLTFIAETVLDKAIEISWKVISEKYGTPDGRGDTTSFNPDSCGFSAVAYGKLGGIELGYNSDIDLVFIHSGDSGMTIGGPKSIENTRFYTMLGQRIINILTMHTPAGTLYETDMRLRPNGQSGMIVSHIDAFREYAEKQAWTWEHQAIVRARPVWGDKNLHGAFNKIRKKVLTMKRDSEILKSQVMDMREKMRKQRLKPEKDFFDLKQDRGGIVDIEFLVQYLVLKNSHDNHDLIKWTDNVRLVETLAEKNLITKKETRTLKHAYLIMRKAIHRRTLQEKKHIVPLNEFDGIKKEVMSLYKKYLHNRNGP